MGFLPYVLLVMVPGIVLSLWAAYRVKTTYAKWDKVDSGISMNAFDFARYLLNAQGLNEVKIEAIPGSLTDNYDPRSKTLRVSSAVAGAREADRDKARRRGRHATDLIGIALREAGHGLGNAGWRWCPRRSRRGCRRTGR